MASNDDVKRLREQVRKRRAAATAKIARMRRNNGIDLSGTEIDPRRAIKNPSRYNAKQLNTYLSELNGFMSREVNFTPDAKGRPLRTSRAREHDRLQRRVEKLRKEREAVLGNIKIAGTGLTVEQRKATLHPTAAGSVVNSMFPAENRKASDMNGEAGLEKSIARMQEMLSPDYTAKRIKAGREQLDQIFEVIGMSDLTDMASKLNDFQFDVLFNESGFMRRAALTYDLLQRKMQVDSLDRGREAVLEKSSDDLRELLEWAGSLKTPGNDSGKATSKTET